MIKQVIIVRKDLNMRKGKMIAQGAHASLTAYRNAMHNYSSNISVDAYDWANNDQTKICVSIESEEELKNLYMLALQASLPCSLILDKGLTEFKEPTLTACAIGPAKAEEIDKITSQLKLL